jgi:mono/diheme cytochrome c family protein
MISDLLRSKRASAVTALVVVGLSGAAFGLPWDIDMNDAQMVKAYERIMAPLPEGVISQPNLLSPFGYSPNFVRGSPEGEALVNPVPNDAEAMARGEHMFQTYCSPCHGDGINLGPVAAPGRYPGVAVLASPNGRLHLRSDGWIYLTMRNGGGIMPSYGWAMTDTEMWSVVRYVRTLPDAAYNPAPATPAAPVAAPGVK